VPQRFFQLPKKSRAHLNSTRKTKEKQKKMAASSDVQPIAKPVPHVIPKTLFLLCGLPGSGKTTFAKKLSDTVLFDWLSQEEHCGKNRKIFNSKFEEKLRFMKKHFVIDRCNHSKEQRNYFIQWAKRYNIPVVVIVFNFSVEECEINIDKRIRSGKVHPSINNLKTAREALDCIKTQFEFPELSEGIGRIYQCNSFEEIDERFEILKAVAMSSFSK